MSGVVEYFKEKAFQLYVLARDGRLHLVADFKGRLPMYHSYSLEVFCKRGYCVVSGDIPVPADMVSNVVDKINRIKGCKVKQVHFHPPLRDVHPFCDVTEDEVLDVVKQLVEVIENVEEEREKQWKKLIAEIRR